MEVETIEEAFKANDHISTPENNIKDIASHAMYEVLKELCLNNSEYFKSDASGTGNKLKECFDSINTSICCIEPLVRDIRKSAFSYDFDEDTPGNGYHSFVIIVDTFVVYTVKKCKEICENRASYFFGTSASLRNIEACAEVFISLTTLLKHLKTLISWSKPGELFSGDEHTAEELFSKEESLNQCCFYGRCLGFQFCDSMQRILKGLSVLLASFSEVYYSDGGVIERATNSLWHSSKYVLNPELRAQRIVNISQYASVDFCKQFWFLGENALVDKLPNFIHPTVAVNKLISIPPEPMTALKADGTVIDIPIPSAHVGPASLSVRLLSGKKRDDMMGVPLSSKEACVPKSRGLLFHCHGGGFVAQSSRSHETYLRHWAQEMSVPILSIDYSLAPEAPFPRAVEDTLYAYCWALNNANILGTTAEKIVFAGDSAGANLCIALTMKCIELGIRPPDGLFVAYVPVVISLVPSPARLLCLMDPLLPFGFLMGCLKAYACSPEVHAQSAKYEPKLRRKLPKTSPVDEPFEEFTPAELQELVNADDFEQDEQKKAEPTLNYGKDEHVLFELPQDAIDPGLPAKISKTAENITSAIKYTISSLTRKASWNENLAGISTNNEEDPLLAKLILPCPPDQLDFVVPHDPYLSPFWASDDVLLQFPPTTVLTLQLDPCLDDCVEFAKKLKRLKKNVKLEILSGLPHGFLNFAMLSKEALEGSKTCIQHITALFGLED